MNDIQILKDMLNNNAMVELQTGPGRPSVDLTDSQSGSTVKIKGLPHDSIVIRAEDFENPLTIFKGTKGERKRADFVIVSNDDNDKKWIICIETQERGSKKAWEIIQQLKGAACFINYCKCIGKSYWNSDNFLDSYECRFVSIVEINPNKRKRKTQPFYSGRELHNRPEFFKKISQGTNIYFNKLIHPEG